MGAWRLWFVFYGVSFPSFSLSEISLKKKKEEQKDWRLVGQRYRKQYYALLSYASSYADISCIFHTEAVL